jgi:hydroxymethylpyrimidine pyrophosphatase-like HAD family hydrolase
VEDSFSLGNDYNDLDLLEWSGNSYVVENAPQDEDSFSLGNDYNDLDLLEWSGNSYVVENAPQDLRMRFSMVASHNQCGVAEAIERWITVQGLSISDLGLQISD